MKLVNEQRYNELTELNGNDFYGSGILKYAERWADLMEQRMGDVTQETNLRDVLENIAQQASHDADTDGITGFMYGCAAKFLAECWLYGEQLRQWHNRSVQLGDEGDRANAGGGTLNPAILVVNTD